jgi:hypothetical protein
MKKPGYEKPTAIRLSGVPLALGNSCWTGAPEYLMGNCSVTGDVAVQTCVGGSIVYPPTNCNPAGSSAGFSCVDGTGAG